MPCPRDKTSPSGSAFRQASEIERDAFTDEDLSASGVSEDPITHGKAFYDTVTHISIPTFKWVQFDFESYDFSFFFFFFLQNNNF